MKSKLFLLTFVIIMVMGFASSIVGELPEPLQLNKDCVNIVQQDSQATINNVTFILTPNGLRTINAVMQKQGVGYFNYTYCGLNYSGYYTANGVSNYSQSDWNYIFQVTNSGSKQSTSEGINSAIIYLGSIILMIIIGLLGFKFVETEKFMSLGIFLVVIAWILLLFNIYFGYSYSINYVGAVNDSGVFSTILTMLLIAIVAGMVIALVMLLLNYKKIYTYLKRKWKTEAEENSFND